MSFIPFDRMLERVERGRGDSDLTYFHDLLLFGELALKLAVLGTVAGIGQDKDRLRYQALHSLVRADGLGAWTTVLDNVLTGPSSQFLAPSVRREQREFTEKVSQQAWQYQACARIRSCLETIGDDIQPMPTRIDGRQWCHSFVRLRNKTRGHGAPPLSVVSALCADLGAAVLTFAQNFSLFQREWVYLHRNYSGKYRVVDLGNGAARFNHLKSTKDETYLNGIYVDLGEMAPVQLFETTVDLNDFYVSNGDFTDRHFECMSYITGDKIFLSSKDYLAPVGSLPRSETEGLGQFSVQGRCFGNLPTETTDYVRRSELEEELERTLCQNDRHPIITLYGSGGVGKTSLALRVCHRLAAIDTYAIIVWFSARDIDLLPAGPKIVKPRVLTIKDIASDYAELLEPANASQRGFSARSFLEENLQKSEVGKTLFIFDNFETVGNPVEVYTWLDTFVRLPNKILITTRHREFKGDYPVKVTGMKDEELNELIDVTANRLRITSIVTRDYKDQLRAESDGHPYVVKMLLGDVAQQRKLVKVERLIASSDEILTALFERTYIKLSPAAQRCFLTVCGWRSNIPVVALEAVLLSSSEERFNVSDAVEELQNYSFIEITRSERDEEGFISVPFVASKFAQQKLSVHPLKQKIAEDTQLLQQFGGSQNADIRHGVEPRIGRIMKFIARAAERDREALERYLPMIEFLARRHPPTWLSIAEIYQEAGAFDGLQSARDAVRHFLETAEGDAAIAAWKELARLCRETNDSVGEIHALLEMCENHDVDFNEISNAANRLNAVFSSGGLPDVDRHDKRGLFERLVGIMVERIDQANATDLSRLAWLCLHLKDETSAIRYTRLGLDREPDNWYCRGLGLRLGITGGGDL